MHAIPMSVFRLTRAASAATLAALKPVSMTHSLPASIDQTSLLLSTMGYVADRALSVSVFLALKMGKPLFLEGEPGTGKTEIAKVLSQALGRRLLRLQCYEGLDASSAVYEWNYAAQMIEIRLAESAGVSRETLQGDIFSPRFLIKRPLLDSLEPQPGGPPVLLIDELDRADEPFEAFLLEILSDFQVTIPETGTIKAAEPPIVIITSNRTREIHDAVKRRCLYHWVDYPSLDRELDILRTKAPGLGQELSRQVAAFVQTLRGEDLFKKPGVAETIDWASALAALEAIELTPEVIRDSLGVLLKYQDDIAKLTTGETARLIAEARHRAAA
jgi:MoxR-like ATPase